MTFKILTVCSANICRSPVMSFTLERSLFSQPFGSDVVVRSGGVNAARGDTACQEIVRLTGPNRVSSRVFDQHRSAPLTDELIEGADLILAADRQLRAAVVKRARPTTIDRTFTLREAAQLAAAVCRQVIGNSTNERLRDLTAQMNHSRGFTDLPTVERVAAITRPWRRIAVHTHDIPDAHGDPQAPHPVVLRLIVPAAEQLADCLAIAAFGPSKQVSR